MFATLAAILIVEIQLVFGGVFDSGQPLPLVAKLQLGDLSTEAPASR
jgi:hypothetical protein